MLLIALTVAVPCLFVVTLVFNGLASADTPLYKSDTSTLSDKYYLEITPSGWTFSIWGVIYTWQALWIIYTIINLFRKTDQGPLYANPVLMNVPFLVSYLINLALNCTWLITFDREILEAAFTVLALMIVTLIIPLVFSYRALDANMDVLVKQERKKDVWLTRMLVHNGLSMYATWCTIATLLNLAMVLTYRSSHDISQQDASTTSLSVLSAAILVFLIADWFVLDRYTRYTFTPYIVLVVALTGSLTKNYEEGARNTTFTIVLLAVAGFAAIVKCFLIIWRHCKHTTDGVVITSDGNKV